MHIHYLLTRALEILLLTHSLFKTTITRLTAYQSTEAARYNRQSAWIVRYLKHYNHQTCILYPLVHNNSVLNKLREAE